MSDSSGKQSASTLPNVGDVYIDQNQWIRFKAKAIAFVPNLGGAITHDMTQAEIVARSRGAGNFGKGTHLTSPTLGNIIDGEPVTYVKAASCVYWVNKIHEERRGARPLHRNSVVLAVFSLPELEQMMEAGQITVQQLRNEAQLKSNVQQSTRLIAAVRKGARLNLELALRIHRAVVRITEGKATNNMKIAENIKAVARKSNEIRVPRMEKEEGGECILKYEDIVPAPATGHPWAYPGVN